jgi:hypothetical protein
MTNETELKNWIESGGNWINPKRLREMPNGECIVAVISTPEIVTKVYKGEEMTKLEMEVELEGKQYKVALNKTTVKALISEIGGDLQKWVGLTLKLDTIPTQKGDSIRARPYSKPKPATFRIKEMQ